MKRILFLVSLTLIALYSFTSCNDTTYAQELKAEQQLISDFIDRNNIEVLSDFPTDSVFGENQYVKTSTGLYFHLSKKGTGDAILAESNTVVPRYKEYKLTLGADTISKWTTVDYPYPTDFIYGNGSSCAAFQEAASYMKRNDSEAKIIVPSKIGFEANWTPATPVGYIVKIRIKK
jgi:hypothetical protein